MQDLASLYTEEELKGIAQVVSLLEGEGRAQRSAQRREQILQTAAGMRKELGALGDESRRKALLSQKATARVEDASTGSLLNGDADEEDRGDIETARKSGRTLKEAKKRLHETLDTADETADNLDRQTQQMRRIQQSVNTTQTHQGEARQLLRETEAHERRSKLIMYGAVAFIVVALIVAAYYILFV